MTMERLIKGVFIARLPFWPAGRDGGVVALSAVDETALLEWIKADKKTRMKRSPLPEACEKGVAFNRSC